MIKILVRLLIAFILLYFLGLEAHKMLFSNVSKNTAEILQKIYLFHSGFSILICINLLFLKSVQKLVGLLGFIYLGALMLKIIVFTAVFYQPFVKATNLAPHFKLSIVATTIIFLFVELLFVIFILKRNS